MFHTTRGIFFPSVFGVLLVVLLIMDGQHQNGRETAEAAAAATAASSASQIRMNPQIIDSVQATTKAGSSCPLEASAELARSLSVQDLKKALATAGMHGLSIRYTWTAVRHQQQLQRMYDAVKRQPTISSLQ